ncbi:MAG TPA: hypothetical protein VM573_01705 [Actinomycetota bacterium]|nr:hypothetical protein [Actinomycetota bacterium]
MNGRKISSFGATLLLLLALAPGATAGSGGFDGMAIPLAAPSPDWYTAELHAKAEAAGRKGKAIPLPDGVEVDSALLFTGVRPGSWMISPAWCTTNFVFGSATGNLRSRSAKPPKPRAGNSGVYIGTAGHCADTGESVSIVAAPGVIMNIGVTVKSIDNGVGDDFALIEIYPEMAQYVNPSMAILAGPTGSEAPAFGTAITHVGHGLVVGTGGTARPGLVTWTDKTAYGWDGAAAPGDSGSGVRAAGGNAVGNLTHLVVGTRYLPAYIAGTTIDRMLQIASAPLATASLVPDPLP